MTSWPLMPQVIDRFLRTLRPQAYTRRPHPTTVRQFSSGERHAQRSTGLSICEPRPLRVARRRSARALAAAKGQRLDVGGGDVRLARTARDPLADPEPPWKSP